MLGRLDRQRTANNEPPPLTDNLDCSGRVWPIAAAHPHQQPHRPRFPPVERSSLSVPHMGRSPLAEDYSSSNLLRARPLHCPARHSPFSAHHLGRAVLCATRRPQLFQSSLLCRLAIDRLAQRTHRPPLHVSESPGRALSKTTQISSPSPAAHSTSTQRLVACSVWAVTPALERHLPA